MTGVNFDLDSAKKIANTVRRVQRDIPEGALATPRPRRRRTSAALPTSFVTTSYDSEDEVFTVRIKKYPVYVMEQLFYGSEVYEGPYQVSRSDDISFKFDKPASVTARVRLNCLYDYSGKFLYWSFQSELQSTTVTDEFTIARKKETGTFFGTYQEVFLKPDGSYLYFNAFPPFIIAGLDARRPLLRWRDDGEGEGRLFVYNAFDPITGNEIQGGSWLFEYPVDDTLIVGKDYDSDALTFDVLANSRFYDEFAEVGEISIIESGVAEKLIYNLPAKLPVLGWTGTKSWPGSAVGETLTQEVQNGIITNFTSEIEE